MAENIAGMRVDETITSGGIGMEYGRKKSMTRKIKVALVSLFALITLAFGGIALETHQANVVQSDTAQVQSVAGRGGNGVPPTG